MSSSHCWNPKTQNPRTGELVDLSELKQRKEIKNWMEQEVLSRSRFSITLNFEYGVQIDAARKAVSIFMNQVDRNLIHCRDASEHPDKRCQWTAFPEGQEWDKRLHFHIQVGLCPEFSGDDLKTAVRTTYAYILKKNRFGLVVEPLGTPWMESTCRGYNGYVTKEIMSNDRSLEQVVTHSDRFLYPAP